MKIDVLDKGFVFLHNAMGDDNTIANAARVSYHSVGDPEANKALVEKLYRNGHGTPFEHVAFTFQVKAPELVFRQWVRHRIGSFNVQSRRYTEVEGSEFYVPDEWRTDDGILDKTKVLAFNWDHGADQTIDDGLRAVMELCMSWYQIAIKNGISREQARLFLPGYAVYSDFVWTVNARSLMNFLEQRLSQHAQWEIRQYARAIWEIFETMLPATAAAFRQEHEELFE